MNDIIYTVSGLHCGGCVSRVKNALTPYAEQVEVTLKPPCVTLKNPNASLDDMNKALSAVGDYVLSPPESAQFKTRLAALHPSLWLKR
jgi:copper chaperone